MVEKRYEWSFEISGPSALFSRPDSGSSVLSYPAPTRSAIIGMLGCVVFSRDAYFWPERVEICSPISYHKYIQNYNGPLRKSGGPFQLMLTVLENVDYKVYGCIKGFSPPTSVHNPMHQLQDVFMRRLANGVLYRMPSMGLKEFTPRYFGPVRSDTVVDRSINLEIPSMLDVMYDRQVDGKLKPQYLQNVQIREGVLCYAE